MRLWTLHPRYLDPQGLVALWRESLLARAVLRGQTRGYRQHPQLDRFRDLAAPRLAINAYLLSVWQEAQARGYAFDRSKIGPVRGAIVLPASSGQLACEWQHLLRKLQARSPDHHRQWQGLTKPRAHPLFTIQAGPVASWERSISA